MSVLRDAGAAVLPATDIGGYGSPRSRGRQKWALSRIGNPSQLPRIGERERRHPPRVLIQNQRAGDRRLGALAAIFALAEPAVDADRRALGLIEIDPGGVNQAGGMADFPTEPDGKPLLRVRILRPRPAHRLCGLEKPGGVRTLPDQL